MAKKGTNTILIRIRDSIAIFSFSLINEIIHVSTNRDLSTWSCGWLWNQHQFILTQRPGFWNGQPMAAHCIRNSVCCVQCVCVRAQNSFDGFNRDAPLTVHTNRMHQRIQKLKIINCSLHDKRVEIDSMSTFRNATQNINKKRKMIGRPSTLNFVYLLFRCGWYSVNAPIRPRSGCANSVL